MRKIRVVVGLILFGLHPIWAMATPTAAMVTSPSAQVGTHNVGYLNVFTDLNDAEIWVDNVCVGRESLVKLPLPEGAHWVVVKLNSSTVYSSSQVIHPGRTSTVVSDHFVDLITDTPSRGAIDREARRLRESRGNFGLGMVASTLPQPAASIKWWPMTYFGVQLLGLGEIPDTQYHGMVAGRLLWSPGDKVFDADVVSTYAFVGTGTVLDHGRWADNYYAETGIGVELKLGKIAQQVFVWKYLVLPNGNVNTSTSSDDDLFKDVLILGILNLCYVSGEVTLQSGRSNNLETGFSFGGHVYF